MAQACFAAKDLARAGDFEPFRSCFFRLTTCDRLGHGAGKVASLFGMANFFHEAFRTGAFLPVPHPQRTVKSFVSPLSENRTRDSHGSYASFGPHKTSTSQPRPLKTT